MDIAERLFYFSALPGGGRVLTAAQLLPLAASAVEREYSRGEIVIAEGEDPDRLIFIAEGLVELRQGGRVLGTITPPGVVGVRAVVARVPMPYECVVTEPAMCLEVSTDRFLEILEDDFNAWRRQLKFQHGDFVQHIQNEPQLLTTLRIGTTPFAKEGPLDLVERMLLVRRSGVFGRGSVNALAEIAQQLVAVDFAPGETIFKVGDAATEIFMLIRGHVQATMPSGETVELEAGAGFGGSEATAELPRFYTAVATEETHCLRGHMETLLDVIEDNPEVGAAFLSTVARALLAHDVAKRVAAAIEREKAPS